jgi:hypothetical protein
MCVRSVVEKIERTEFINSSRRTSIVILLFCEARAQNHVL